MISTGIKNFKKKKKNLNLKKRNAGSSGRPLLATILLELRSCSNNHVYMYHVFPWLKRSASLHRFLSRTMTRNWRLFGGPKIVKVYMLNCTYHILVHQYHLDNCYTHYISQRLRYTVQTRTGNDPLDNLDKKKYQN